MKEKTAMFRGKEFNREGLLECLPKIYEMMGRHSVINHPSNLELFEFFSTMFNQCCKALRKVGVEKQEIIQILNTPEAKKERMAGRINYYVDADARWNLSQEKIWSCPTCEEVLYTMNEESQLN